MVVWSAQGGETRARLSFHVTCKTESGFASDKLRFISRGSVLDGRIIARYQIELSQDMTSALDERVALMATVDDPLSGKCLNAGRHLAVIFGR